MINPESWTLAWIEKVSKENIVKDMALTEKTITTLTVQLSMHQRPHI